MFEKFIKNNAYRQDFYSQIIFFEVLLRPNYSEEASKANTGYVGLVNEGTTCYVNSLL